MRPAATTTLLVILALAAAGCGGNEPDPGTVRDEAMRAGLPPSHFVRATPDYFRDMDDNLVRGSRPSYSQDEIEGRNMWMVWTGGNDRLWNRLTQDSLGSFDLLKTISSHRATRLRASQPLGVSRPGQRTVLHRGDRARSEPVRPLARRAGPGLPTGSVREREGLSGSRRRRARQDRGGRFVLRRAHRDSRPASLHQPRLRRGRAAPLELRAVLQRQGVLLRSGPRPAVSRRHDVRFLPRRAEPDPSAGRRRSAALGESQRARRRTVFLVGPRVQLDGDEERRQRLLSGAARLASRHARHLARLHRQHQQPADDERRVPAAAAHGPGEGMGQGKAGRRRARQQAVQPLRRRG